MVFLIRGNIESKRISTCTLISTRRRLDVVTTLFGRQQRCYNVETSCAYWGTLCVSVVYGMEYG